MQTIGERIRSLREYNGISQVKLADMVGITKMTLSKYEHNLSEPRGMVIALLSESLNTSADYLLGLTEDPSSYGKGFGFEYKNPFQSEHRELLDHFRKLNGENQIRILERMETLLELQTEQQTKAK